MDNQIEQTIVNGVKQLRETVERLEAENAALRSSPARSLAGAIQQVADSMKHESIRRTIAIVSDGDIFWYEPDRKVGAVTAAEAAAEAASEAAAEAAAALGVCGAYGVRNQYDAEAAAEAAAALGKTISPDEFHFAVESVRAPIAPSGPNREGEQVTAAIVPQFSIPAFPHPDPDAVWTGDKDGVSYYARIRGGEIECDYMNSCINAHWMDANTCRGIFGPRGIAARRALAWAAAKEQQHKPDKWPTHCIHGAPIPDEGAPGYCEKCKAIGMGKEQSEPPATRVDSELPVESQTCDAPGASDENRPDAAESQEPCFSELRGSCGDSPVESQGTRYMNRYRQIAAKAWCTKTTSSKEMDAVLCEAIAMEIVGPLLDGLEYAWTIIANAGQGSWERESEDWRKAAEKFRDEVWHRVLSCRLPDKTQTAEVESHDAPGASATVPRQIVRDLTTMFLGFMGQCEGIADERDKANTELAALREELAAAKAERDFIQMELDEIENEFNDKAYEGLDVIDIIRHMKIEIDSGGAGKTCCHGYAAITPADVELLEAERDRQHNQNVDQACRIASLQAELLKENERLTSMVADADCRCHDLMEENDLLKVERDRLQAEYDAYSKFRDETEAVKSALEQQTDPTHPCRRCGTLMPIHSSHSVCRECRVGPDKIILDTPEQCEAFDEQCEAFDEAKRLPHIGTVERALLELIRREEARQ